MFTRITQAFTDLFEHMSSRNPARMQELMNTLEQDLIQADVPLDIARSFVQECREELAQAVCPPQVKLQEHYARCIFELLKKRLQSGPDEHPLLQGTYRLPIRIMLVGLQGSGKTTTTAKIAKLLSEQHPHARGMLASVDTTRPAGNEQLGVLAQAQGWTLFERGDQSSARAIAQSIMRIAPAQAPDILIVDTAGRLPHQQEAMHELQDITRTIAPDYTLLVLDGMMGQQSLEVARIFAQAVKIDGIILTKMDSDTRGGVAFAGTHVVKAPIVWMGTGERSADLLPFKADRMAQRMMGGGDLQTLWEKAERKIAQSEKARPAASKEHFTYLDFAQQLALMNSFGSFQSLLSFLPHGATKMVKAEDTRNAERFMRQAQVFINSMTPKERIYPDLVKERSRQERIARGAGMSRGEVASLIEKFEQLRAFVKLMDRQFNPQSAGRPFRQAHTRHKRS